MSKPVLDAKHFHDECAAFAYLEARIWPNGPVCPHCGGIDRIGKLTGKSTRIGIYKCYQCRKPFRATVGTVFEASHVPVRLWLQAIHLLAASKKGISSNQLHRVLGVSLKTAWFMSHRIREAMRVLGMEPLGGPDIAVGADETFFGRDYAKKPKGERKGRGYAHKFKVLSLIDRDSGEARSFKVDAVDGRTIIPIIRKNVAKEAMMMTDEAAHYQHLKVGFAGHEIVRHSKNEYGRGNHPHEHD